MKVRFKMKNFQARQGDIFFRSISKLPEKANLNKKTDAILAYGEVTGHSHSVTTPISDCESYVDENGDIYIRSDKEMNVGHDEHNTIILPANEWICVTRQREYSPLEAERERKVRD
jgi:hypothetical protein